MCFLFFLHSMQSRASNPVFGQKPDPRLYTTNEGRIFLNEYFKRFVPECHQARRGGQALPATANKTKIFPK